LRVYCYFFTNQYGQLCTDSHQVNENKSLFGNDLNHMNNIVMATEICMIFSIHYSHTLINSYLRERYLNCIRQHLPTFLYWKKNIKC